MITDYDPIAEQYQRSKQQPWRTFIEAFSFLSLVGNPAGKSVLDMACGEGFYSRMLRQRGAARVTGVDLSEEMIQLARQQEAAQQLGVEYLVGDAREATLAEPVDLVVAAYLLNYAATREQLQSLCESIARCLQPGGRFVTVNCSPLLNFPAAPSYRKYGFETRVCGDWKEGAGILWKFYLEDSSFEIENYYLDAAIHEEEFRSAGFREVRWHPAQLSPEGAAAAAAGYWTDFLDYSPIALIECVR